MSFSAPLGLGDLATMDFGAKMGDFGPSLPLEDPKDVENVEIWVENGSKTDFGSHVNPKMDFVGFKRPEIDIKPLSEGFEWDF